MKLATLLSASALACTAQAFSLSWRPWRAPDKPLPIVEVLTVYKHVTTYGARPTTIHHTAPTVTETVGVLATAITHQAPFHGYTTYLSPPPAASPRPSPDLANNASPPRSRSSYSLPATIEAFGQWVAEPSISPLDIAKWTFAFLLEASFLIFTGMWQNRMFIRNMQSNIKREVQLWSLLVWTPILVTISYLGFGSSPYDPMDWLCHCFQQWAITYAGTRTYEIWKGPMCAVVRWWHPHKGRGTNFFKVLWSDIEPAILATCAIWLPYLWTWMPWLSTHLKTFALVCFRHIILPLLTAAYVFLTAAVNILTAPANNWFLKRDVKQRPGLYDVQLYLRAAGMSTRDVYELLDLHTAYGPAVQKFNLAYVIPLARRCLAYRATGIALLDHCNHYRTTIDLMVNEERRKMSKYLPFRPNVPKNRLFQAAMFEWCEDVTKDGVHFQQGEGMLDPWGLGFKDALIGLPGTRVHSRDAGLMEDIAAQGKGLEVWMEEGGEDIRPLFW